LKRFLAAKPLKNEIVVDAKDHLVGRLASIVAKQLLEGKRVTLVRCEKLTQSGKFIRNKFKFLLFLRKRRSANPKFGHHHHRSPSRLFFRAVRGMIPHKTQRGQKALSKLKVYEGVPQVYENTKTVVVPEALRILRLRPGRKYTDIGRMCSEVGWVYGDTVKFLEQKRIERKKKDVDRVKVLRNFAAQAEKEFNNALNSEDKKIIESVSVRVGVREKK